MRNDRPGYQFRDNKNGRAHYWNPKRAVKGAPDYLAIKRLPDGIADDEVTRLCQELTDQLKQELREAEGPPTYDRTIKSLITCYRLDKTSSWHTVKHSTRIRDYEPSLRMIEKAVGDRRIDLLKASDFRRWFTHWKEGGHRKASGAIKMLRIILSYGAGEHLAGCKLTREILADMKFDLPPARTVVMTYDQCLAIVKASAKEKCPSIGFVEALKFETALRRIDVIGEYRPAPEGGPFRWHGLMATDVSADQILTLTTSKTGADVCRDLKVLPLVQEALKAYRIPDIGPLVYDEDTKKPYWDNRYTEKFKKVRTAAGVPDNVWSMDTRAGAVSETIDAMGSMEAARELATHTSTKMTERYVRTDGLEASRKIAEARLKSRPVKRNETSDTSDTASA